jgi:hypothetical protein
MKKLEVADDIPGPEFIRLTVRRRGSVGSVFATPDTLTVAEWRDAQQVTVEGDDKNTLRQFRMATMMLELAARHSVPDDVILMPTLGWRSDRASDLKADPRFVLGADGGLRWKQESNELANHG